MNVNVFKCHCRCWLIANFSALFILIVYNTSTLSLMVSLKSWLFDNDKWTSTLHCQDVRVRYIAALLLLLSSKLFKFIVIIHFTPVISCKAVFHISSILYCILILCIIITNLALWLQDLNKLAYLLTYLLTYFVSCLQSATLTFYCTVIRLLTDLWPWKPF